MLSLLIVVHIVLCLLLVTFVLLQDPKGGGANGLFGGGGANSVLGTSGTASLPSKITTWVAGLFFVSSLVLSKLTAGDHTSVLDSAVLPAAPPAATSAPTTSPVAAPTDAAKTPAAPAQPGAEKAPETKPEPKSEKK